MLKGLFSLCERLFGVSIRQATPTEMEGVQVWHDDVRYYVVTENKKRIASFFLDPFSRPAEKRYGVHCNYRLVCALDSSLQSLNMPWWPAFGDRPHMVHSVWLK